MKDKIIKVSGFGVDYNERTQCDYMLVGITEEGKIVMSTGDGVWTDVTGTNDSKKQTIERT